MADRGHDGQHLAADDAAALRHDQLTDDDLRLITRFAAAALRGHEFHTSVQGLILAFAAAILEMAARLEIMDD
jgi:hypothetical protein